MVGHLAAAIASYRKPDNSEKEKGQIEPPDSFRDAALVVCHEAIFDYSKPLIAPTLHHSNPPPKDLNRAFLGL